MLTTPYGDFPTKEFNGYTFATDELFTAISDAHGNVIDEDIDNQIAFYFDRETFENSTPAELYNLFKKQ